MPIILPYNDYDLWIDRATPDIADLTKELRAYPVEELEVYEVGQEVTSGRKGRAEFIMPTPTSSGNGTQRDGRARQCVTPAARLARSSRIVERTFESGNVVRLRLEPIDAGYVRILEYHRKTRDGGWHRCPEEDRHILYSQLKLHQGYTELFAGLTLIKES